MTRARLSLMALVATLVLPASRLPAEPAKSEDDKPFHKELLQVAKDYKTWGRVDDEARFGLLDCRMPEPAKAHVSASKDANTHGQKLYSLFAKEQFAYWALKGTTTVAVGQVVVKESWLAEEIKDAKPGKTDRKSIIVEGTGKTADHFYPFATKDGKVFKATKPTGLFIMMKLDPKTPDTDEGWVYGTVSADLKTVTAAGKIESCMKCHQDAKNDRLFGLKVKE